MNISNPTVLLGLNTVLQQTGGSKSQHYIDVNEGVMVPPVEISERGRRYPLHEVEVIQSAKVAGATKTELKTLVKELLEIRKQRFLNVCSELQVRTNLASANMGE